MSDKRTQISAALKESLKNRQTEDTATIRLIMAALKDRDINARVEGKAEGIDENEILSMLGTMIKQRQESIKMYVEADRVDLAEKEEAEVEIIKRFLPEPLSKEELESALDTIIADLGANCIKDMGRVMAALKEQYAGQVDMKKAGEAVKAKLG